jgi:hypothetical protein
MTFDHLLVILLVVGVVMALFPVDERIKKTIAAVVIIVALVWILRFLGFHPGR